MEDEEKQIRDELSGFDMSIKEEESFMSDNIDSFVALSRENTSVKRVEIYIHLITMLYAGNYEFWDKAGQIVGNLVELTHINIHFNPYTYNDDRDERRIPDWETLTRILLYVRHKISLGSQDYEAEVEDIQGLARAIHGHPMISAFDFPLGFTFANMGPWCSALTTLFPLSRVLDLVIRNHTHTTNAFW